MRIRNRQIGWHILLCIIVFLLLMPIIFAVSNSFKTLTDAFNTVFQVIPLHPTLENYIHVFEKLPFVRITMNTFAIAAVVTAFKTITSLVAAYSFVYFDFKGKSFLYFVMLATMFIPFTVTMIPTFCFSDTSSIPLPCPELKADKETGGFYEKYCIRPCG